MYASQIWWNLRKSCMQRLRVPYNLDAELYTTSPGERMLVCSHDSSVGQVFATFFTAS